MTFAIVAATLIEMNTPTKSRTAEIPTATRGFGAPVAIEVAIALAVSWKPFVKSNATAAAITRTRTFHVPCNPALTGCDSRAYSVVLNSQIAIPSITMPSAKITNASSSEGTCHPHQVTPGSSACRAAGEIDRCENTSRRIGSTA